MIMDANQQAQPRSAEMAKEDTSPSDAETSQQRPAHAESPASASNRAISESDEGSQPVDESPAGDGDGGVMSSVDDELELSENDVDAFMRLYKKGKELEQCEQLDMALECYMTAVDKMSENNTSVSFQEIPECLHRISNIYFLAEEYDKALKFAETEKLYYETALLGTIAPVQNTTGDGKEELSTDEVLARRADEFERLSKLCLSDKRPKLALDYCGKASQLRQKVFGEDHPKTVQSLDMFAGIYAEVGRKQYADALLTVEPAEESPLSTMAAGGSSGDQPSKCHHETTSSGDGNLPAGAEIPSCSASTPDRVQAIRLRAGGRARTAIDGTESRLNAGYAEQTPVESSDTDETSVRRHSPSGESDHGRGSSGYKILTTSDGRRRRHVAEEQRTGADVQSSYEVAEDSAHAVSACTLLVFFLISSMVAVLVSILWCHWAQTASCRATENLLLNLGDHYEHIRTKVIMAAW